MSKLHSFDILRKYDNRACNKSVASLGMCACDRMPHTDRHDDFLGWIYWQFPINIFERRKDKDFPILSEQAICNCYVHVFHDSPHGNSFFPEMF